MGFRMVGIEGISENFQSRKFYVHFYINISVQTYLCLLSDLTKTKSIHAIQCKLFRQLNVNHFGSEKKINNEHLLH